jgi:hypothetical protein
MPEFDPTRIIEMARILDSGTSREKLDVIEGADPEDPMASGVLMRALEDPDGAVRLAALEKMGQAGIRPIDEVLDQLVEDEDARIRVLAEELRERPDTLNPLEKLIPMIEAMAVQLGPLGVLLKRMIGDLKSIGANDEKEQLLAVQRVSEGNPAGLLVIQQGLRSRFISVRIGALRKVLTVEGARVPTALMAQFITDPSAEVREAADAAIKAGKVGDVDPEAFREQAMESMLGSLLGGLSDLGGGMGGAGGGLEGLGNMFGLDLGSLFGAGQTRGPAKPHQVAGYLYLVGDGRIRDRILRFLERVSEDGIGPDYEALESDGDNWWAIEPVTLRAVSPGWPEHLQGAGLELGEKTIAKAEQSRRISEQVWGAAFADHTRSVPVTIVFHDGILSRAEWSGDEPGTWPQEGEPIGEHGPITLLRGFLEDPTDDALKGLSADPEPLTQR